MEQGAEFVEEEVEEKEGVEQEAGLTVKEEGEEEVDSEAEGLGEKD